MMSIKIKKDGKISKFIINANDIKVIDADNKFKDKTLESVINDISDTEKVHFGTVDVNKDGLWIDMNDGLNQNTSRESTVVDNLKNYFKNIIGDLKNLTTNNKKSLVDAINENTQKIQNMDNPNILINGDFQIWQRGKSFYNKQGYCADRWQVVSETENVNIEYEQQGIEKYLKMTTGGFCNLYQIVENSKHFSNKSITLSFDAYSDSNVEGIKCVIGDGKEYNSLNWKQEKTYSLTTERKRYSFTFSLSSIESGFLNVIIFNSSIPATIHYTNVKLELGETSTPFISKDFCEELNICKRYYQKCFFKGLSYGGSTDNISINENLPISMREIPKIIVENNKIFDIEGFKDINFTFESGNIDIDSVKNILSKEKELNGNKLYNLTLNLDAEIY